MAENKNSFVLYRDLIHTVRKLPKEKQADLFMHILQYVNDENPVTDDFIIELAFEPIKQSLKRDLVKYQKTCEKNRENAEKRWNANNATASDGIRPNANDADSDTDSGSDKDILLKKETKYSFKADMIQRGFDEDLIDAWLVVRKLKKGANTKIALDGFVSQINESGLDKNEILKICVEKSWAGFKPSWLIDVQPTLQNGSAHPYAVSQQLKKDKQDELRKLTDAIRANDPTF